MIFRPHEYILNHVIVNKDYFVYTDDHKNRDVKLYRLVFTDYVEGEGFLKHTEVSRLKIYALKDGQSVSEEDIIKELRPYLESTSSMTISYNNERDVTEIVFHKTRLTMDDIIPRYRRFYYEDWSNEDKVIETL